MKIKWTNFWDQYRLIEIKNEKDLLYQVGKTVKGEPINNKQFEILQNEIINKLRLSKEDILIDLCCRNGVLTHSLAPYVNNVLAIDFSEPFIKNANQFCFADNIKYYVDDINNFNNLDTQIHDRNVKILMYDALAYFDERELNRLLKNLKTKFEDGFELLIASILDQEKKWIFFNSLRRKFDYIMMILFNNKGLGSWWSKSKIRKICTRNNLKYFILSQDEALHTSHYRFDVLIKNSK